MARTPDPVLKQELLDQVVGYLAVHGIGMLSLGPMAEALEMSRHRLKHHFGPREELIAAALRRATEVQEDVQAQWFALNPAITQPELFRKWWRWLSTSASNLALVRLGLEAATLDATISTVAHAVRAEQIGVWRTKIEDRFVAAGVPRKAAAIEATQAKAMFTGLVVDLMASGETKRLNVALDSYLTQLSARISEYATDR